MAPDIYYNPYESNQDYDSNYSDQNVALNSGAGTVVGFNVFDDIVDFFHDLLFGEDETEFLLSGDEPELDLDKWNTSDMVGRTNCYAYAMDLTEYPDGTQFNPRFTHPGAQESDEWGLQPGYLSGVKSLSEYAQKHGLSEADAIVELCKADAEASGRVFKEIDKYAEPSPGTHKVALFVGPGYHWYRQDADGMWSHKNTTAEATNLDDNGEIISDPEEAAKSKDYTLVGYFEVGD